MIGQPGLLADLAAIQLDLVRRGAVLARGDRFQLSVELHRRALDVRERLRQQLGRKPVGSLVIGSVGLDVGDAVAVALLGPSVLVKEGDRLDEV